VGWLLRVIDPNIVTEMLTLNAAFHGIGSVLYHGCELSIIYSPGSVSNRATPKLAQTRTGLTRKHPNLLDKNL
jgi:hypothetical protein